MQLQLQGKTALVTASSGGIGLGIAGALADAGVRVAVNGRSKERLEQAATTIAARSGLRPSVVVGDVCTNDGPEQIACRAASVFGGRIDILINNAGGARPFATSVADSAWIDAMTLNFFAARRLTELVIPSMKSERWGRIVSISGALVAPTLNGAAPAKAALVSWSRTLSAELGPFGITVNTIAPGRIHSAQIHAMYPTAQARSDFVRQNIPAGYFGEPFDVGHLVAFLASPLARYINGASIPVDGGAVRRV